MPNINLNGKQQGFQYSTDEQWTGEYWIDGSKIYTKKFSIPNFSTTAISVDFGITDINELISVDGTFKRSGYDFFYTLDNTYMGEYRIYPETGTLNICTNHQYVTLHGFMIIEYTCVDR